MDYPESMTIESTCGKRTEAIFIERYRDEKAIATACQIVRNIYKNEGVELKDPLTDLPIYCYRGKSFVFLQAGEYKKRNEQFSNGYIILNDGTDNKKLAGWALKHEIFHYLTPNFALRCHFWDESIIELLAKVYSVTHSFAYRAYVEICETLIGPMASYKTGHAQNEISVEFRRLFLQDDPEGFKQKLDSVFGFGTFEMFDDNSDTPFFRNLFEICARNGLPISYAKNARSKVRAIICANY